MNRRCGDCTACCTALGVVALGKPAFSACAHCRTGRPAGCGVYQDRPQECRVFECGWLRGVGSNADRPDRSGVVLSRTRAPSLVRDYVQVHEARQGAAATGRGKALVDANVRAGELVVALRADGTRSLFGPPEALAEIALRLAETGTSATALGWDNPPEST